MTLAVNLGGKTILVCGVQRGGIGGATARQIARAGGAVIALDYDAAAVEGTIAEVESLGGSIRGLIADLADIGQCESVIARVLEQVGPFDGIVNVAGGTADDEWSPLDLTPSAVFRATLQLNFGYVFYLCRDAAHFWIEQGRSGSIVNVGSISALAAAPWHGPYGAAKSGISALTRTMAHEWHEFGIRANTVAPGAVLSARVLEKAKLTAAMPVSDVNNQLIFTETVDLGNAITFLLSDLAAGISGQTLVIDRSLSTRFCAGGSHHHPQSRGAAK
jgi:NAD(P)-dependent dehydrogenase (short-subunit alcohol dehydrogenase family)